MYLPYFNALKSLLNQNLNTIKTIDWYNQQYERYEDMKAVTFPAAYIEFENAIKWQDAGISF